MASVVEALQAAAQAALSQASHQQETSVVSEKTARAKRRALLADIASANGAAGMWSKSELTPICLFGL